MKKVFLFLSLFFVSANLVIAQTPTPGIKWQKCLGGTGSESSQKILKSRLGGYILTGQTNSKDFDVVGYHGTGNNGWIVKTDEAGNIVWQKCLDGGNIQGADELENGDIIVIGEWDAWVTRLDRNGNIKWSKSYGTSGSEQGKDIKATDGGFIFIASEQYITDTWIVKINDSGDILWDKKMSGISSGYYESEALMADSDGGFLVYGDFVSSPVVTADLFLAKFNNEGNLIWMQTYESGGEYDELAGDGYLQRCNFIRCKDGGYLLVAVSKGNVYEDFDLPWIVKADSLGMLMWKQYVYSENNYLYDVKELSSGEFVLCGRSYSTDNMLYGQGWILKLSSYGGTIWQKAIGGFGMDEFTGLQLADENNFIMLGSTSSNDGNFSSNHGITDIMLMEVSSCNNITGYTFIDNNFNSQKDPDEKFLYNVIVASGDSKTSTASSSKNGYYRNSVDTGQFTTNVPVAYPYYTIIPDHSSSNFTDYNNTDIINFAFQPLPGKKDAASNLIALNVARAGFDVSYKIVYENIGTTDFADGTVQLIKDPGLTLISAMPNYASVSGDTIKWNYANLKAADAASIIVNFRLPPQTLGNVLHSYSSMFVDDDLTPGNNIDTLNQTVIGSYDPNDKTENHAGTILKSSVAKGDWLTYTIRFQNTGTDTAFNIFVRDTLESKLDWNSLEMIDASHNYQLNINDGNKCAWYFNNVLLPDSIMNEPASHGYLVYRIKPKASLVTGDVINNSASIFFDYNLPVQTNTEKTIVANDLVLPLQLLSFSANHNGKTNLLKWSSAQELNTDRFEIQRSSNSRDFATIGNIKSQNNNKVKNDYTFTDAQPLKQINYYRLKMLDKDGKISYSTIKNINNSSSFDVVVYPNPVHQNLTLNFNTEKAMPVQIEIVNDAGRKVYTNKMQLPYGSSFQQINIAAFAAGSYFIKCISTDGQTGLKFVKQ